MLQKLPDSTDGDMIVDPEITFKKRGSSSSEERIDTSDEMIDAEVTDQINQNDFNTDFIVDRADNDRRRSTSGNGKYNGDDIQVPDAQHRQQRKGQVEQSPKAFADDMIREAEASRARLQATPGKQLLFSEQFHSTVVDENYTMIGSQIDQSMKDRIKRGEYVDFAKLLPHDKMLSDEGRLEIINKGGHTFFVPALDRSSAGITGLGKWEQAFRVYSNIHLSEHHERTTQLLQYNHIICTAASSYI